jgi:hypothetical protein
MTHNHINDFDSSLTDHLILAVHRSVLYFDCGSVFDMTTFLWKPLESEVAWIRDRLVTAAQQAQSSQAEADTLQDILDAIGSTS